MKIEVRYLSKSGNTKKLAEAIASEAKVTAYPISQSVKDADILFLGGAIYAFGIDNELKNFISSLDNRIKKVAIFSTAALVTSAYGEIKKLLTERGITVLSSEFHCRGEFKFMHKGRPNENDIKSVKEFTSNIIKGI